ncbi:hypothetical protein ES703_54360 [subsurface metagenome]
MYFFILSNTGTSWFINRNMSDIASIPDDIERYGFRPKAKTKYPNINVTIIAIRE